MANPSLLDEVMATVESHRVGNLTWFEKLTPDAQATLDAVRTTYDPKMHKKHVFARALIAAAEKRGIPIAREKQVIRWLENRP
jgi:hypothetical protein